MALSTVQKIRLPVRGIILLFSLFLMGPVLAQQTVTEVIPLGYRSLFEIIPIVQPLIAPEGSVSGLQGQLVVTATPQKMVRVRKVLASLDKAPARLLISVRRGDSRIVKQDSASVQGNVGNVSINNGGIDIGQPHHESGNSTSGLSVRAKSNRENVQYNITQQVQVLEGREAFIAAGQEVPVRNRGVTAGPNGIYSYDSTSYYPAVTGFYATPRLNGDEVFLELNTISRQSNNIRINGRQPQQNFAVNNIRTTARGKLGKWIAIGGTAQSGESRQHGIASANHQQRESSSQLYVRVEEISRQGQ